MFILIYVVSNCGCYNSGCYNINQFFELPKRPKYLSYCVQYGIRLLFAALNVETMSNFIY
jgi:hypothetical protein